MFVPTGSGAPVTLVVVAYGSTPRLRRCLDALIAHEARTDFEVVCVANPDRRLGAPDLSWADPRVAVRTPDMNLGWAGGLHLARADVLGPYMAWIQDDMRPRAGWLDALVDAANAHPRAACFGSLSVDDEGRPDGVAAGRAFPAGEVRRWNDSDDTRVRALAPYEEHDWVTSKGLLVRVAAWDDVGGPAVRFYPLNHVDKQFATHLRAHGWRIALVPGATLAHGQSQSSPSLFRGFLNDWHEEDFDAVWGPVAAALAKDPDARPEHPCPGAPTLAEVERECAVESSRMVVPLAAFAARQQRAIAERYESSRSWKLTAPLRRAKNAISRLRRRRTPR